MLPLAKAMEGREVQNLELEPCLMLETLRGCGGRGREEAAISKFILLKGKICILLSKMLIFKISTGKKKPLMGFCLYKDKA